MEGEPGAAEQGGVPELPLLPGFREMALRRMSEQRRSAGLSQTEVAARMGTSQSAVARLETGDADVRVSTLERYAAAIGSQLAWQAQASQQEPGRADPGLSQPGAPSPGSEQMGAAQSALSEPGRAELGLGQPGLSEPGEARGGPGQEGQR